MPPKNLLVPFKIRDRVRSIFMHIIKSPEEMQNWSLKQQCAGKSVGFVPTMGALHRGHLALCERARAENDVWAASIFVNPTQFAPTEDLAKYPRPFERDCELLQQAGCSALFAPDAAQMYANDGAETWVEVPHLGARWEGAARPGHLRGVATVVAKLFNIARPARAYFGEKDFQQLRVVQTLAKSLDMGVDVVACETVRESDGLALSSRNVYLSHEERQQALALSRSLFAAREEVENGERDATKIEAAMREMCAGVAIDYIAIVEEATLNSVQQIQSNTRALIAARVGTTRLIDNLRLVYAGD